MSTSETEMPLMTMKSFCNRVGNIVKRRNKQDVRPIEISAPFDLRREPISIPGISDDEISILREKEAASRLGVAELMPPSPSSLMFSRPSTARGGYYNSSNVI